jgi:tRNA (guanine-N7-)-methyltransferase
LTITAASVAVEADGAAFARSHERRQSRGLYADAPRLPGDDIVDLPHLVRTAFRLETTGLNAEIATGAPREIELEIGPGSKAGFLVERACASPEAGLIGLEIRPKWAVVGDGLLAKVGHTSRARVFCEDARSAMPRLRPDGCVARIYLHFPDPWWKKRHAKRLVMGELFLVEVARLLVPGGELFVQTDIEERANHYARIVTAHEAFEPAGDVNGSPELIDNPYGARTPREHRAIADGLPIHRLRWRRRRTPSTAAVSLAERSGHSSLNTSAGSTRAARIAGMPDAIIDTTQSTAPATTKVHGSVAVTPNNNARIA